MSTGAPGICGIVRSVLRTDGKLGLNDEIVRLHVRQDVSPAVFWSSYLYVFGHEMRRAGQTVPVQTTVTQITVGDKACAAIEDVALPIYGKDGKAIGVKALTVVFTSQVLEGTGFDCATIDENGEIVNEEPVAVPA